MHPDPKIAWVEIPRSRFTIIITSLNPLCDNIEKSVHIIQENRNARDC